MSYLKEKYEKQIKNELQKELELASIMAVPTLSKIVVNVGIGEALKDKSVIDTVLSEIELIAGQKPVVSKAKVSISNFKLREGDPVGVKLTLRGGKMWDFAGKLIDIVFPRIKDFRGFSVKSFDNAGNYTVGIEDQTVFFEIDPNKVIKLRGMEITFVTTAVDKKQGQLLLSKLGFPFKETRKIKKDKK